MNTMTQNLVTLRITYLSIGIANIKFKNFSLFILERFGYQSQ